MRIKEISEKNYERIKEISEKNYERKPVFDSKEMCGMILHEKKV